MALLSLPYLDEMGIKDVVLGTLTWRREGARCILEQGAPRSKLRAQVDESLFMLTKYSPYGSADELLQAALDAVRTPTGTAQEIFHLHKRNGRTLSTSTVHRTTFA